MATEPIDSTVDSLFDQYETLVARGVMDASHGGIRKNSKQSLLVAREKLRKEIVAAILNRDLKGVKYGT